MGKIVLLDDLTINQIAAGEVIERPASVVKELVENSIDAGAKNVTVDIKNGGISYIRVIDDGSGIMKDDMEIAFERHATSKIRQAKDLDEVKSMGFRGEALASIAAISKMELVSRTEDSEIGYKISAEGGKMTDMHEEGTSKGTTITVKELFFNTPVRYKFLKKDFTESGYIEDTITRIALANPGVAIKLVSMGKTVIQTNGNGDIKDCIYAIFGKEVFENILEVDYTYEDYHVTGVVGKPIISRSNRSNQLFFVNNRFVKDKTLTSAAEQAFKGLVTIGKHGFLVLNIDMDPKKVDVNVHPTKLEVRFQEEQKIFKAVLHGIKETLLKSNLISDPVKDYSDQTPNDILKEINNKDRVEAWGINKKENTRKDGISSSFNQPEFTDFKTTISKLDKETREKFIKGITNAKTSDEIYKELTKFNELLKEPKKEDNKEEAEDTTNAENEETNVEETKVKENEKSETKEDETKETTEYSKSNLSNLLGSKKEENIEETTGDLKVAEDTTSEETVENEPVSNDEQKENAENELVLSEKQKATNENETASNDEQKATAETESTSKEEQKETTEKETEEQTKTEKLSFEEMYKKLFGRDIETAKKEFQEQQKVAELKDPVKPITNNEISLFEKEGIDKKLEYKFIGIVFKTYIILSIEDEMYIMDQHAAHERIMYEKVKANYYNDKEKDSQLMLLPDIINLNNKEMGIFRDNKEMFNRAGFIVEEFGDNTVKLTGVPEFCLDFDTKEIFLETLDEIDTVARTAKQELEDKFLATVACKAAVKANMALSKEEVDSLMDSLLKLPNPFSCPHGRPTVIKMSKTDIEKKFSRR